MEIIEVKENRRQYMELLILADEQEEMIEKYIDTGGMYILCEGETVAECIVAEIGKDTAEIKSIATYEKYQRRGYAKTLLKFVEEKYRWKYRKLQVVTGESPLTLPFYKKCGYRESGRIENFFTDNSDHEIIEGGVKLKDMIYLEKDLNREQEANE